MALGKVNNIIAKITTTNKFVMGFMVLAVSAVVGSVSIAGAQHNPNATPPANKADCKKGGYTNYGYRNQGSCVSASVRAQNGGGYGNN